MWDCKETNKRGEEFEAIIINQDLTVMNEGKEKTFKTIRAESIIDITVINRYALQYLCMSSWYVDNKPSFSDNRYIQVSFDIGQYEPRER